MDLTWLADVAYQPSPPSSLTSSASCQLARHGVFRGLGGGTAAEARSSGGPGGKWAAMACVGAGDLVAPADAADGAAVVANLERIAPLVQELRACLIAVAPLVRELRARLIAGEAAGWGGAGALGGGGPRDRLAALLELEAVNGAGGFQDALAGGGEEAAAELVDEVGLWYSRSKAYELRTPLMVAATYRSTLARWSFVGAHGPRAPVTLGPQRAASKHPRPPRGGRA
ncbi:hypothetical protein ACP70R_015696 [Stipagrostis hirtigluma subsp. patula]